MEHDVSKDTVIIPLELARRLKRVCDDEVEDKGLGECPKMHPTMQAVKDLDALIAAQHPAPPAIPEGDWLIGEHPAPESDALYILRKRRDGRWSALTPAGWLTADGPYDDPRLFRNLRAFDPAAIPGDAEHLLEPLSKILEEITGACGEEAGDIARRVLDRLPALAAIPGDGVEIVEGEIVHFKAPGFGSSKSPPVRFIVVEVPATSRVTEGNAVRLLIEKGGER